LLGGLATVGDAFNREAHPLKHGGVQRALVLEVPIQGAASDAGLAGDLLQRGVGDTAREKNGLGSVEQRATRGLGLIFGTAHQAVLEMGRKWCIVYVRECM